MNKFVKIDKKRFNSLMEKFRKIQQDFLKEFEVDDIFSNSKIYEIIIANSLNHNLIPGHSGSKDAKNDKGKIFEYKHYKETSSNHTWTFNDYSEQTIKDLKDCTVIFAHIDDTVFPAIFDWYYEVEGKNISAFMTKATKKIKNTRKMINISRNNIEDVMKVERTDVKPKKTGKYSKWLGNIAEINTELESCTNVINLLTSNKIWEVLIAVELNHNVNSEQGGRAGAHDAFDSKENLFEYKVSKTFSWNFQDISDNVLNKYKSDNEIILAVVDKTEIKVKAIYSAKPEIVVKLLRKKLREKKKKFEEEGKELRRLQVSITKGDLEKINATKIM